MGEHKEGGGVMGRNQGAKKYLITSKKALKLMGYKSQNTLDQFHADEGFTCYIVDGMTCRGGRGFAWDKREINKWLKTEGRSSEEWLID
jgi:hypothetical protein